MDSIGLDSGARLVSGFIAEGKPGVQLAVAMQQGNLRTTWVVGYGSHDEV
jgi:hypothetical protein